MPKGMCYEVFWYACSFYFFFRWKIKYEYIHPDVLLINQVEQVPHYRAILETLGIKALIATYAHYVPYDIEDGLFCYDSSLNNANLGISIVSCFLSGLQLSDIVFTHSKLSLSLLMALYKKTIWNSKKKNSLLIHHRWILFYKAIILFHKKMLL